MSKFIDFSAYNKHQVFLTSGRVVINAREDNLFLLSKKDLVISSGGDVHINVGFKDSKSAKLIVNSPRIQLGLGNAASPVEPVAKGDSLTEALSYLSESLAKFTDDLSKVTGTVEIAALTRVALSAKVFNNSVSRFNAMILKVPSKKTFSA